ncbi:MAG: nuclear transport factor 2 family protein [Cyclobacteriaceae bacterium]
MKKTALLTLCLLLQTIMISAQNTDEQTIATCVEKLNQAMIDGNQIMLDELASEKLSYGHSSGLIENKETFVTSIVNGKFGFSSIDLTEQTIITSKDIAIVRHKFLAATDDKGKDPGTAKLSVMQVWQQEKGKWVLIGRQATKI